MASEIKGHLIRDGLVFVEDFKNPRCYQGSTSINLADPSVTGTISQQSSLNAEDTWSNANISSWANDISEITFFTLIHVLRSHTGYAEHPVSKWNSSYANNASFILYHFGNYLGNGSQLKFRWYGNQTAGDASGWTNISNTATLSPGGTYLLTLQCAAPGASQLWVNDTKAGSAVNLTGNLGQTSSGSSLSHMTTFIPPGGSDYRHAYNEAIAVYDRKLTDDEVRYTYNIYKGRTSRGASFTTG